jgi:hypothetical protein
MRRKRTAPSTVRHPLFGDIPLLAVERLLPDGRTWKGWRHDPDYAPPLPRGAVRGDVRRQHFCPMCHVPRYFYLDQEKRCVQCGESFVFGALEQKFWYESLHFHFDSTAIRCGECRRRRRSVRALNERLARVRAALVDRPDDPALLLELAEAIVSLHERAGRGPLDDAVSAARRSRRLWPEAREALFWEGAAHAAAGRVGRASALLMEYLERPGDPALRRRARSYLDQSA